MSGTSYELDDYGATAAIMAAVSPSPAIPGFAGIFGPNETTLDEPKVSSDPDTPTVFATSRNEYTQRPSGFFDGASNPHREGRVVVAIKQQAGTTTGYTLELQRAIAAALKADDGSQLCYLWDEARSQAGGVVGPWWVHIVFFPFVGT